MTNPNPPNNSTDAPTLIEYSVSRSHLSRSRMEVFIPRNMNKPNKSPTPSPASRHPVLNDVNDFLLKEGSKEGSWFSKTEASIGVKLCPIFSIRLSLSVLRANNSNIM